MHLSVCPSIQSPIYIRRLSLLSTLNILSTFLPPKWYELTFLKKELWGEENAIVSYEQTTDCVSAHAHPCHPALSLHMVQMHPHTLKHTTTLKQVPKPTRGGEGNRTLQIPSELHALSFSGLPWKGDACNLFQWATEARRCSTQRV